MDSCRGPPKHSACNPHSSRDEGNDSAQISLIPNWTGIIAPCEEVDWTPRGAITPQVVTALDAEDPNVGSASPRQRRPTWNDPQASSAGTHSPAVQFSPAPQRFSAVRGIARDVAASTAAAAVGRSRRASTGSRGTDQAPRADVGTAATVWRIGEHAHAFTKAQRLCTAGSRVALVIRRRRILVSLRGVRPTAKPTVAHHASSRCCSAIVENATESVQRARKTGLQIHFPWIRSAPSGVSLAAAGGTRR